MQALLGRGYRLVRLTLSEFARHRSGLMGAALAFHTLVCMAPLVIVAVAIAGVVFGRGTAHLELQRLLEKAMGPQAATEIDRWVVAASQEGELAGVVGLGLTLLAASKLGMQLRHVLNHIWDVDADPFVPGVVAYVRRRLFAIATAAAAGPILVLFLLSRSLVAAFDAELPAYFPPFAWLTGVLEGAAALVILASAAAAALRYIPDTTSRWRHAYCGGLLTAVLVTGATMVVGRYLAEASGTRPYEAAGAGLVVLLWLYFAAYTFLMGAELTQILSRQRRAIDGYAPAPERTFPPRR